MLVNKYIIGIQLYIVMHTKQIEIIKRYDTRAGFTFKKVKQNINNNTTYSEQAK